MPHRHRVHPPSPPSSWTTARASESIEVENGHKSVPRILAARASPDASQRQAHPSACASLVSLVAPFERSVSVARRGKMAAMLGWVGALKRRVVGSRTPRFVLETADHAVGSARAEKLARLSAYTAEVREAVKRAWAMACMVRKVSSSPTYKSMRHLLKSHSTAHDLVIARPVGGANADVVVLVARTKSTEALYVSVCASEGLRERTRLAPTSGDAALVSADADGFDGSVVRCLWRAARSVSLDWLVHELERNTRVVISGHGLGGCLAAMITLCLATNPRLATMLPSLVAPDAVEEEDVGAAAAASGASLSAPALREMRKLQCVTFGAPLAFDEAFVADCARRELDSLVLNVISDVSFAPWPGRGVVKFAPHAPASVCAWFLPDPCFLLSHCHCDAMPCDAMPCDIVSLHCLRFYAERPRPFGICVAV